MQAPAQTAPPHQYASAGGYQSGAYQQGAPAAAPVYSPPQGQQTASYSTAAVAVNSSGYYDSNQAAYVAAPAAHPAQGLFVQFLVTVQFINKAAQSEFAHMDGTLVMTQNQGFFRFFFFFLFFV